MRIKVSKFDNHRFLPYGLEIEIEKFRKFSPNLYRFTISHPSTKYIDIDVCSTFDAETKKQCELLGITESVEGIRKCKTNYKNGKIRGASIKILCERKSKFVFFRFVPLKWKTLVFVICDATNDI